jgi:D-glycero-D-manno-heptose 1,7-bisphosphate phosphatase
VINRDLTPYIATADDLEIFPWTLEALALLDKFGYEFFIISNQQAVGRGLIDPLELDRQTEKIAALLETRGLAIKHFYYCTSLEEENDPRRKPGCAMIEEARDQYGVDPSGAFMIGDRWSDIEAGVRGGCRPLLVESGGAHGQNWKEWQYQPEMVFPTLLEAAQWIVSSEAR